MATSRNIQSKVLTDKQRRFCDEYLKDFNAKWAAVRAGYPERTAKVVGYDNLNKPLIAEAIAEKREKIAEDCEIDIEKVTRQAAQIAFSSIRDYLTVGKDGAVTFKNFAEIDPDKLTVIESVRVKITDTGYTIINLKLHNKLDALEKLFKMLGLYRADNKQNASYSLVDILAIVSGEGGE